MKKNKERKKILKIRPFNMANFSGGSGYLVFSLFYQFIAVLPAMVIIWFFSLFKLPKEKDSNQVNVNKALKRYYAVSVPVCILLMGLGLFFACIGNYGTFGEYWIEILFVGVVPAVCMFFVMRFCHGQIVIRCDDGDYKKITAGMIFLSIVLMIILFAFVFTVTLGLDAFLTEMAEENYAY